MKKIILVALAIIIAISLISCGKEEVTTSPETKSETAAPETTKGETKAPETTEVQTSSPETSEAPETSEVPSESNVISVSYKCKANDKNSKEATSNEGSVSLSSTVKVAAGDVITVKLSGDQHYILFKLAKSFSEALIYVPGDTYTLTVPSDIASYWPSSTMLTLSARYPSKEELGEKRNLALNPYDVMSKTEKTDAYPHVYSNNNYNNAEFGAHNAIDGFITNNAHGTYPNQSWGPNSTVKATDVFKIDFGREIVADELVSYVRGDFSMNGHSHDAYFSEYKIEFSDGTSITVNPVKTRDAQTFSLGGKTTSYIKITGFVTDKTNSDGWAGFAEIRVMGSEIQ